MRQKKTIDQLKDEGIVTTANNIPPPVRDYHIEDNLAVVKESWVKEIEDFCEQEGILPHELIGLYKDTAKKIKLGNKLLKEVKVQDFTKDNAVGRPYNPFDNRIFKTKMGIK